MDPEERGAKSEKPSEPGGYVIPPERMDGARQRLDELRGFLEELESLNIGTVAPAATFDPSWEPR